MWRLQGNALIDLYCKHESSDLVGFGADWVLILCPTRIESSRRCSYDSLGWLVLAVVWLGFPYLFVSIDFGGVSECGLVCLRVGAIVPV